MFTTQFATFLSVVGLVLSAVTPLGSFDEGVAGGWSESDGLFVVQQGEPDSPQLAHFAVNHRGKAENKSIRGTSHKRAHGWTTWPRVYHYTTARLEHYWPYKGVITSSGRQWGTGGTEAKTKWIAFNPNAASNGYGKAHTYYGKNKR